MSLPIDKEAGSPRRRRTEIEQVELDDRLDAIKADTCLRQDLTPLTIE